MSKEDDNYIELGRLFREYREDKSYNEFMWGMDNKPKLLHEILEDNRFVVILGDKGAGKTTEIRQMLNKIKEKNNFTFFFKLDDLASTAFSLSGDNKKLYDDWGLSNETCTVFLDSIDECRLNSTNEIDNFEKALRKFTDIFNINEKCQYIITSRESDWKHEEDKAVIKRFLYIPSKLPIAISDTYSDDALSEISEPPKEKANEDVGLTNLEEERKKEEERNKKDKDVVYVCQILSLEQHQIEKIAKEYNITNFEDFIGCLKNNVIPSSFYSTPIECIDTINHFKRYGTVPEKLSNFLHHKLFFRYWELNEKYENLLTLDKIEKISKRLAVATILCRKPSIMLNESYSTYFRLSERVVELGNSLSMRDLFPDENGKVLKHYIHSMLFSSNGTNQVKFYNEYVKNYVAYLWFKERIDKNRFYEVKDILFQRIEGKLYPRISLIIPIVMLAEKDYEFRKILINNTPDLLVKYSPYCCLSDVDRVEVLRSVLTTHYHKLRDLWGYSSDTEMAMYYFARNCLIKEFKTYYSKVDFEGQALLISLLKYISIDRIDASIRDDILWDVVYNSTFSDLKSKAIDVLIKFEDKETINKLEDLLRNKRKTLRDYSFYKVLKALYPRYLTIEQGIELFLADDDDNNDSFKDMVFFVDNFVNDAFDKDKNLLYSIVKKIEELIKGKKTNLYLLLYVFAECLKILLSHPETSGDEDKIVELLLYLQGGLDKFKDEDEYKEPKYNRRLSEKVKELRPRVNTSIKNLFFKAYFRNEASNYKKFRDILWNIGDRNFLFYFQKENLESIIDFYNALTGEDRKDVLTSLIVSFDGYEDFSDIIKPFIENDEDKAYCADLVTRRKTNVKKYNRPNKYEIKEKETKRKNIEFLKNNINKLENGEDVMFNAMLDMSYHYMDRNSDEYTDLSKMRADFGEGITKAYIAGVKKYWLRCNINDYKDYINSIGTNTILNNSIIALAGIPLSLEDKDFTIDSDAAKRLIYFGCQSLNNFPKWFNEVVLRFKDEAKEIIMLIVKKVFEVVDDDYSFINKLSRLDANIIDIFYNDIWGLIEAGKIKSQKVLKTTIEMLLLTPSADKQKILKLIKDNINYDDWKDSLSWVRTSFFLSVDDFSNIINEFKTKLNEEKFPEFIISLFSVLERYSDNIYKSEDWKDLDSLAKLIPIVFKYVSPKDDQHHDGVYSPNNRDNAQHFRSQLLNIVGGSRYNVSDRKKLVQISGNLTDTDMWYKNFFLKLADNILVDDSNVESIKEKDIIDFENGDDLPANSSEDLFKIVCNKLGDIKSNIELSDYSLIKELYHHLSLSEKVEESKKREKEEYFQLYMLKEMRLLAKNLYSSLREPEVSNNKKPDLQVWEKSWCINIECKIAESWSFSELKDAIEKQLVGQYLKHHDFQYGVLLLANIKERKRGWIINNKKHSFDELVMELQKVADKQYKKYNHIREIKVMGIRYY